MELLADAGKCSRSVRIFRFEGLYDVRTSQRRDPLRGSESETADEFAASCTFSNRGTWSNGTRCAMETLAKINEDTDSLERFLAEQAKYRVLLQKRADAFLGEAERVGLNLCSYRDGFFISIPCDDPKAAAAMLEDQNIFIVALKKGLRFAPQVRLQKQTV